MIFLERIIDLLESRLELIGILLMGATAFWAINRRQSKQVQAQQILRKAVKSGTNEPFSLHPRIDPTKCAGCGACTTVCPEGDIIKLVNHKAQLVGASKCVGHGECERACPFGAIDLVFGTKKRGVDIPRVTTDYETNVPGLYIAGELGGMGLIRNAVKQGYIAATHALKNLKGGNTDYDLIIIGGGPAGLASALTAIAEKKSYLLLEQNSFGGTVYNFPRQKVVMTYPAQLPIVGTMKFAKNKVSKEELLGYWKYVRKRTGLKVMEKTKFETLEKTPDGFKVQTSQGLFTGKKVILCMGVRGSPRKLGLPNEDLPKVAYNLLDPEQYQGKHVAVVGGGNAAVEAAQYLGKSKYRNKVILLVRGDKMDRCNEENKNIIQKMAEKNLVEIWYHSSVSSIEKDSLQIKKGEEVLTVNNDFLFVFIGAEMPHKFLMSLGIEIDKKFGTPLKKAG